MPEAKSSRVVKRNDLIWVGEILFSSAIYRGASSASSERQPLSGTMIVRTPSAKPQTSVFSATREPQTIGQASAGASSGAQARRRADLVRRRDEERFCMRQ